MEDPILFDPPSNHNSDDLFPDDAEPLAAPPLDGAMLSGGHDLSLPENFFDTDFDLEFNLDDLDFDYFLSDAVPISNSESLDHRSSLSQIPCVNCDQNSFLWSPVTEGFNPGFADGTDRGFDAAGVSDMEHGNNDRDSSGHVSSQDSRNRGCNFSKASNCQSSVSGSEGKLNYPSPESGSCDQLCSHGSGECNSGVSQKENSPSPDSCEGVRDFSTSFHDSSLKAENFSRNGFVDFGSKCNPKRKREQQEEGTAETRTSKFRKSSITSENANTSVNHSATNEEDDKRKARLMRNRESALLSRQRKKQYVEELEDKVRSMHSTITELNCKISYIMAENATLRQQLSGGGMCPPPPPGMYPTAPMAYPWMPCPSYVVKPQGSLVPLVPIPRLKPPQPASASKVRKKSEKLEKKKSERKAKKVASISFLGLLFFMLLFGGLVPIVNVRYGGIGGKFSAIDRFNDAHRGRASMVDGGGKGYSDGRCGHEHDAYQQKHMGISLQKEHMLQFKAGTNGSVTVGNYSEPLVASLYVPRNDKLVRIDGNLIIHSVLASERAVASDARGQMKTSEETRLAIAQNYIPSYHVIGAGRSNGRNTHLDRNQTGRPKALGSGSADNFEPSASDGRLQQWFREDLAGPVLSSGMCTEVFQFDVSPSPGSIVPATSMTNITSEYGLDSTKLNSSRNRRILRGHSIPLNGHSIILTDKHAGLNTEEGGLQGNKSSSSMVVSVLVDPIEASDIDGEGMMRSKPLSRIFVVVLIDSVKYVTYSCMLPLMGSSPHLVNA